MTPEELKAIQKEAKKKKRIATECASEVHDLVEDTLWTNYENLEALAQKTVQACREWAEADKKAKEAEALAEA